MIVHAAIMSSEAVIGLVGVLSGRVLASVVSGWLGSRAQVAEELREQRLEAYPKVWEKTTIVSRWPRRSETTYAGVGAFHRELRTWYYEIGGLFMSANARRRYGHMQDVAEVLAATGEAAFQLTTEHYDALRDACSDFRNALTEDLESRRQRSFLSACRAAIDHVKERWSAKRRLRALGR